LGWLQFVQRVLVMFMPAKYQPDYMFLRNVPMRRVHLFTAIQFACIVVLCVIKELGIVSIIFPVMVSARLLLLLTFILMEWYKWYHSFAPGLKPSFSANPSHCSPSFLLLKYSLHGFPGLFTVISEHICFLL